MTTQNDVNHPVDDDSHGLDDGLTDLDDGLGDPPANLYANVYEFVEFVAELYAQEVSDQRTDFRWCSRWHHHTEAVARLAACWKAFEVLRRDPGTGASVWFRDHLDPCMTALTAPDGPFARCSDTTHRATARCRSLHRPPGCSEPWRRTFPGPRIAAAFGTGRGGGQGSAEPTAQRRRRRP